MYTVLYTQSPSCTYSDHYVHVHTVPFLIQSPLYSLHVLYNHFHVFVHLVKSHVKSLRVQSPYSEKIKNYIIILYFCNAQY